MISEVYFPSEIFWLVFNHFHPVLHPFFLILFASSIIIGALIGDAGARETKHKALKVLAFALSMSICLSIVSFFWFFYKCNRDPYRADDDDFPVVARKLQIKP
jgi:hypothetical protein